MPKVTLVYIGGYQYQRWFYEEQNLLHWFRYWGGGSLGYIQHPEPLEMIYQKYLQLKN